MNDVVIEKKQEARQSLLIWLAYFCLGQTLLFFLIGTKFFNHIFPIELPFLNFIGIAMVHLFIFISFIGHFSLLAFSPAIFMIPAIYLWPHKKLIICLTTALAIFLTILLFTDAQIYARYHFHINRLLLHMILGGEAREIFGLSRLEWLYSLILISIIVVVEVLIAMFTWHWLKRKKITQAPKKLFYLLGSCLFFSYFILLLAAGVGRYEFGQQTKRLFLYNNILATILPGKNGLSELEHIGRGMFTQPNHAVRQLHYPLHPILCHPKKHPYNVVMIAIDTWRFDAVTSQLAPHIYQFAKNAWQFKKHFSGGNSTKAGIFSLFYSLPSNYWSSMLKQKRGPIFFQELYKQDYQVGIFCSAELKIPPYDKTIFHDIQDLQTKTPGETPGDRDHHITQAFIHFIKERKTKQPFYSFLFYNAAHGYCRPQPFAKPFQPAIKRCNRITLDNDSDPTPYINRYNNALHFIDQEIAQVLHVLNDAHLMKDTVIMITGDHGQEFNDSKHNQWEHASNFGHYQIQTPLIIYWPKQKARIFSHSSNHYDIIPFLMKRLLTCQNPVTDYSIGSDLMDDTQRPYLIVGSYINLGVVENNRITTLYPSGHFVVTDRQLNPIPTAQPHSKVIQQVMHDMHKFYR